MFGAGFKDLCSLRLNFEPSTWKTLPQGWQATTIAVVIISIRSSLTEITKVQQALTNQLPLDMFQSLSPIMFRYVTTHRISTSFSQRRKADGKTVHTLISLSFNAMFIPSIPLYLKLCKTSYTQYCLRHLIQHPSYNFLINSSRQLY